MKVIIEEPLNETSASVLADPVHFDDIHIRCPDIITARMARRYLQIHSVSKLTIWCGVTRAAMQHIVTCPKLTELVVFELKKSGRLFGFQDSGNLTDFSCVFGGLTETDLLEITKCQSLVTLRAQQSKLTDQALKAVLALPMLRELDLEDSNFNDQHAQLTAQSKTIERLEIGGTRISKAGLVHICKMKSLKGLDIWSNNISPDDLELLSELPNLEYLSIGGHDDQTIFTAKNTIPKLEIIPSLKHIWLDGIKLNDEERKHLKARYETVR